MIVLHPRALLAIALAEPLSDWLLGEVRKEQDGVAAPAHQPALALQAIADLGLAGHLTERETSDAVCAVLTLPVQAHPPSGADMSRAAALLPGVPFLDGLHIALAERLEVPILTTGTDLGGLDRCEVRTPPSWLGG